MYTNSVTIICDTFLLYNNILYLKLNDFDALNLQNIFKIN